MGAALPAQAKILAFRLRNSEFRIPNSEFTL